MKHRERPPMAERLKQALIDGVRHNNGEISLRMSELEIPDPPPTYGPSDVVRVRKDLNMSRPIFAALLHVSVKTVQSWEQGERKPSQVAARLLQVIEQPDMRGSVLRRISEAGGDLPESIERILASGTALGDLKEVPFPDRMKQNQG